MTSTEENYIKAIFTLSGINKVLVNTNAIAGHLNTSAASVTDMIKKLSDKRLTQYEKYKGVRLSKKGEKMAIELIRKHRLWEVFLVAKMNFAWDEVHEIAEQLEHINSKKLIDRLDSFLGYPKFDPHGDPIPDKDGNIVYQSQRVLSDLQVGELGVIIGVNDSSADFLKYLDSLNIALGSKVSIIDRIEYDGSITVKLNSRKNITLSQMVAKNLYIN